MKLKRIQLAELKPSAYNPRTQLLPGSPEYEKLKRSIQEFGLVDPLIVNSSGTIIGGHQRWRVLADMGATHADCVILDLDEEKEKALNIALNRITGEWDEGLLRNVLRELAEDTRAVTGFSDAEIGAIIKEIAVIEPPVVVSGKTGVVIDPASYSLNGNRTGNDPDREWVGMPEFEMEDKSGVRKIILHFQTDSDVQAFADLIKQPISPKTRYLWFPPDERGNSMDLAYEAE